ncbi:pyridoxamine 5'-phosphate oxidase family protein [Vibrio sp. Of7-15]|uniref:pyridoxamine 5'-phosphate oxidase family protein n=1 Tax=Vibrio sp. Of7-15 TaxID=2724879 RepID=UPI001EF2EA00|nr:pyridoxamine 5'-phosphate oxidase family protein [Vibrio sp. Of7-15]MCG7497259.1 pyridoxamine 5'-phosphate oxidase family protein [Vibrio sp. Of7-15]
MLSKTKRTELKKARHKASFDEKSLYDIIDESKIAHIAILQDGAPMVIPMLAWRIDNHVYIHGAKNSRLLKNLKQAEETCLTFTLFDGWVLARSAFHHSAHYRSAVVLGQFSVVDNNTEKSLLLDHFLEQIAPGRSKQARPGNEKELSATELLVIPLTEASVKISNNPVSDDKQDMDLPVWAGVLPYKTVVGPLKRDAEVDKFIEEPDYSNAYPNRWHQT